MNSARNKEVKKFLASFSKHIMPNTRSSPNDAVASSTPRLRKVRNTPDEDTKFVQKVDVPPLGKTRLQSRRLSDVSSNLSSDIREISDVIDNMTNQQTSVTDVQNRVKVDKQTFDASLARLHQLESENMRLQRSIEKVVTESRLYLEASIEDLKLDFNRKIMNLSTHLQTVYEENSILNTENSSRLLGAFNRKIFLPRESILSKMLHYSDENYKTLFNIAISVLILWGLWLAIEDYDTVGNPNFDLLIWGIFRDLGPFSFNWMIMFVSCFTVIFMAHFAAISKGFPTFQVFILIYTCFQLFMFYFSWRVVYLRAVPFAMPLAVGFMAEQARMSMKVHAYFREKILWNRFEAMFSSEPKCSDNYSLFHLPFPQFDYFTEEISKFGYFMFAPTLIYRDAYPRTARIRWLYVFPRIAEFFGIVYYAFLIFRQVLPQFSVDIGEPISAKRFIYHTFRCM